MKSFEAFLQKNLKKGEHFSNSTKIGYPLLSCCMVKNIKKKKKVYLLSRERKELSKLLKVLSFFLIPKTKKTNPVWITFFLTTIFFVCCIMFIKALFKIFKI